MRIFESMNGCLACKSCSSQCSSWCRMFLISEQIFINLLSTLYKAGFEDHFVCNVEMWMRLRWLKLGPRFFNVFLAQLLF